MRQPRQKKLIIYRWRNGLRGGEKERELCGVGDNRSDRISNGCRLLDERKTFEMGDMDGGLRLRLRELERKRNGRMPTLLPFI